MIEFIDPDLCDGCGVCMDNCPADVIRLVEGNHPWKTKGWKAAIRYPNDCHSCRLCVIDCHADAIRVNHGIIVPESMMSYKKSYPDADP